MKKRFLKLFAVALVICSLIGGGVASAGTLSRYGNCATYCSISYYAYSYTAATGSWASTTMYRNGYNGNYAFGVTNSFGYAYGGSGYAQTPTIFVGVNAVPNYSTHSCNSYTASKSF